MEVGAVGGLAMGGAGALGGGAAAGAAGTTGAAPAASTSAASVAGPQSAAQNDAVNSVNIRFLDGSVPLGLQQLADTLKDFSSAEILFTLLLLAAMEKDDKKKSGGGGAAMGLLAGLALAGQFGRSAEIQINGPLQPIACDGGAGAGLGANLNVTG